jgi:hypothetical protein
MEKLIDNHMVWTNTTYFIGYLEEVEGYINGSGGVPRELMEDRAAVVIDFFPS